MSDGLQPSASGSHDSGGHQSGESSGAERRSTPTRRPAKWIRTTLLACCALACLPASALPASDRDDQPLRPMAPSPPMPAEEAVPAPLVATPLRDISLDTSLPTDSAPTDFAASQFDQHDVLAHPWGMGRGWYTSTATWHAPGIWHRPLYFEDASLERMGRSHGCLQPAVSTAHFFGRMITLPYQVLRHPTCACEFDGGHGICR